MKIFPILSAFIGFAFASTLAQVNADVSSLSAFATTYDNDIIALPASSPSPSSLMQIHTDAQVLTISLAQLASDLKQSLPLPVNEDDLISLLITISDSYIPPITDALSEISLKKQAIASASIAAFPSIILDDLLTLNASNSNLETTFLTTFPGINCHTTVVDSAFAKAIAVYSN
uniref:Uncharacterized protein n=1 Tax=Psilocybe cubensis TaxID=181762 RepID=A0A8H7Y026_PSICU